MNPYLLLVIVAAFAGSGVGGFLLGVDHEKANAKDKEEFVAAAVEAANKTSAEAISKIKVRNTTIQNEVQREIREKVVYAECRHSPNGLRLVNESLSPRAEPGGNSELPGINPPK